MRDIEMDIGQRLIGLFPDSKFSGFKACLQWVVESDKWCEVQVRKCVFEWLKRQYFGNKQVL